MILDIRILVMDFSKNCPEGNIRVAAYVWCYRCTSYVPLSARTFFRATRLPGASAGEFFFYLDRCSTLLMAASILTGAAAASGKAK